MSEAPNFCSQNINTSQHTLYIETLGASSLPVCLLISGAMQGTWGWSDYFCSKIADAGFYVIRFDHRDIGRSSATPSGQEYILSDLAKDVISILNGLNIKQAHLVGHSMGGHLCQQLALDYPDRVISICPIGSGPIGATSETQKPLTVAEQAILDKTWETFLAREDSDEPEEHTQGFLKVYKYLNGAIPMDEQIARTYVQRMIKCSSKKYLQPGNPHEKVMEKMAETLNAQGGILKKIHIPTLILHGELDPISLPRFAVSMAKEIPGAEINMIPRMGHMFLNQELEEELASSIIDHLQKIRS